MPLYSVADVIITWLDVEVFSFMSFKNSFKVFASRNVFFLIRSRGVSGQG